MGKGQKIPCVLFKKKFHFASFDALDAAIEGMNGQHLCNCPITVSYAFKKDSKN